MFIESQPSEEWSPMALYKRFHNSFSDLSSGIFLSQSSNDQDLTVNESTSSSIEECGDQMIYESDQIETILMEADLDLNPKASRSSSSQSTPPPPPPVSDLSTTLDVASPIDPTTFKKNEQRYGRTKTSCKVSKQKLLLILLALLFILSISYTVYTSKQRKRLQATSLSEGIIIDNSPSPSLGKLPLVILPNDPTNLPSNHVSVSPSLDSSAVPSSEPTITSSSRPSSTPTSTPTITDTITPTSIPSVNPTVKPTPDPNSISFYVMGDIPYDIDEEEMLQSQLEDLSLELGEFVVHVGDIQSARDSTCANWNYQNVQELFINHSEIPTFIIPGDNDWNDCPAPDKAWEHWTHHFEQLTESGKYWDHELNITWHTESQTNFAFYRKPGVMFLGLNMVGGDTDNEDAWDERLQNNLEFSTRMLLEHAHLDIKALVVFAHAKNGNNWYYRNLARFKEKNEFMANVPIIIIHGDGHEWKEYVDFDFQFVQVDMGRKAPPIRVTVWEDGAIRSQHSRAGENVFIFEDIFEIDRRIID